MIARLTGRLTDGAERGAGHLLHVVLGDTSWGRALCGRRPGKLSGGGFVRVEAAEPTCPRCFERGHFRAADRAPERSE